MKIRKYQGGTNAGGFNNSTSSFAPQMVPFIGSPYNNWAIQSYSIPVPKFEDYFKKKSLTTTLTDPKGQFKANYPNLFGEITPPWNVVKNTNYNTDNAIATSANAPKPIGSFTTPNLSKQPGLATTTNPLATGDNLKPNFFKANLGNFGQIADIGSALLGPTNSDPTTQTLNTGYDMLSDVAMRVNPLVGTIMKGVGFASGALNKLTKGATTVENSKFASDKILSSKFLALTPLGLINSLGKSSIEGSNEDLAKTINYGYTPADQVKDTQIGKITKIGAKLFGGRDLRKEAINKTARADRENALKSSVLQTNNQWLLATQNSAPNVLERNQQQLAGGFNPQQMRLLAAKKGAKLYKLGNIKNEVTRKFQKGGTMNVIPDGALHSRKNNMDMEGITHKGIPVVSMEEGGEVTQHAEIEREELIFRKELTDVIEEAYKKYKEGDESVLLDIGKLLTYEILENTEDNVGLLETVQ